MLKRICCIFMAVIVLSVFLPDTAFAAEAPTARVVSVFKTKGSSVKMTKGTEKEFNAKAGLKLYDGYTLSTGNESYCYLKLDDNSLLKMDQRSKIKISKVSSNKLSIAVLSGGLLVDAEPQSPGSTVEVSVGNSALAIRGTYFLAENMTNGTAVYSMLEGAGVVDGIALPGGHIMKVSGQTGDRVDKPAQIHKVSAFSINTSTSAFVLQTILDDVDRFVSNGTIKISDVPKIESALQQKLLDINNSSMPVATDGKAGNYKSRSNDYVRGGALGSITLNKDALFAALSIAYDAKVGTVVSTDGVGVYSCLQWVEGSAMNALDDAIDVAENLLATVTTVQQVNDGSNALLKATADFEAVKQLGTAPVPPEVVVLQTALVNSYEAKKEVYISTDGADVHVGSYWVTMGEWKAFNNAIKTASSSIMGASGLSLTSLSGTVFDSAADALNSATSAFEALKKPGTVPLNWDDLVYALQDAEPWLNTVKVDTDGSNTYVYERWVTQSQYDWLANACAFANSAIANYNPADNTGPVNTQRGITFAASDIDTGIFVVTGSMQWGTKGAPMWSVKETGAEYTTLQEAAQAASGGRTIVPLHDNITLPANSSATLTDANLLIDKGMTLDLEGHLDFESVKRTSTITNNGTIIVRQNGASIGSNSFSGALINNGALTVENGGFIGGGSAGAATITNNGTFTNDGEFTVNNSVAMKGTGVFVNNGSLTLKGGKSFAFTASTPLTNNGSFRVEGTFTYNSSSGKLINNGSMTVVEASKLAITSPAVLAGRSGASFTAEKFIALTHLSVPAAWTNFYDSAGNKLTGNFAYVTYNWNGTNSNKAGWHAPSAALNKSGLEALIKEAEDFVANDSSLASTLNPKIAAAKAVLSNATTQAAIDNAANELDTYLAPLRPVNPDLDTSDLKALIKEAKDLVANQPFFGFILNPKIAAAEALLEDASATRDDIDSAADELDSLLEPNRTIKTSRLRTLIKEAGDLVTNDSSLASTLNPKINAAKAVLANTAKTQVEVDAAADELDEALAPLRPPLDTSTLEALIAEAEYMAASLPTYAGMINWAKNTAQTALANATTQAEIDSAANTLDSALATFRPMIPASGVRVSEAVIPEAPTDENPNTPETESQPEPETPTDENPNTPPKGGVLVCQN